MYTVWLDGIAIHGAGDAESTLISPVLETEIDGVGSFVFSMPPTHLRWGTAKEMSSKVEIKSNNVLLWRGRVLSTESGFDRVQEVTCEGVLGFLNDSIINPLDDYSSYSETFTMSQLMAWIIARHNEQVATTQRITLGTVNVARPADDETELAADYISTRSLLEDVRRIYGGHFSETYSGTNNVLNYTKDYPSSTSQYVHFANNLLDVATYTDKDGIATRLLPLGAVDDGERITIASVNSGSLYLNNTAAQTTHGIVTRVQRYDDIDTEAALKTKAQADLAKLTGRNPVITATALDLGLLSSDINSFKVGGMAEVISPPNGINTQLMISRIRYDLADPSGTEITLGANPDTFTQRNS